MSFEIRLARIDDAADIISIYAPYCAESSHVSFETVAPSVEQMRERIERITGNFPWLIGELDGEMAGYVYAGLHRERAAYRWAVEVAVYIAAKFHGRGVGRALYDALFAILRELGYFKAFAGVSLPNSASVGLHESMGFRPAGVFHGVGYKCGRWIDVGWWELELQSERFAPPEPLSFSAIRDSAAVAAALARAGNSYRPKPRDNH